jgi:hypothetical protein
MLTSIALTTFSLELLHAVVCCTSSMVANSIIAVSFANKSKIVITATRTSYGYFVL